MSKPILLKAEPFGSSFKLTIPSEYNRLRVKDMVLNEKITIFQMTPRVRGSKEQRGYLEGAVIWVYANWQYGLDPRKPENHEKARYLFKQDFNYEVVKDKNGNPRRIPVSLKGKHAEALDRYVSWAQENGAPIPNEALYKLWRDQYSTDYQWAHYWDWLEKLGLEHDAHPSAETIKERLKL